MGLDRCPIARVCFLILIELCIQNLTLNVASEMIMDRVLEISLCAWNPFHRVDRVLEISLCAWYPFHRVVVRNNPFLFVCLRRSLDDMFVGCAWISYKSLFICHSAQLVSRGLDVARRF